MDPTRPASLPVKVRQVAIESFSALSIINSVLSNNQAVGGNATLGGEGGLGFGGGLALAISNVTLTNTVLSGNQAIGGAGGSGTTGGDGGFALGAGLYVSGGTVTFTNAQFTGNQGSVAPVATAPRTGLPEAPAADRRAAGFIASGLFPLTPPRTPSPSRRH